MTTPEHPRYALFSALYPPHMGGVETFTRNLAHALTRRGARVTVVTTDTEGVGAGITTEDDIEVVRLPCKPLAGGRFQLPVHNKESRAIDRELRARRWDGVLINTRFYPHSLYGMKIARACGLTPVVLDHGSAPLSISNPLADKVIWAYERAITAWGRHRYRPRYYGISQKSAEWLKTFGITAEGVITNAIDADAFRALSSGRDSFRADAGIPSDRLLVAFAGRLIPEKGAASLVEALKHLPDSNIQLCIAGSGPLEGQLAESAQNDPRISCLGRLDRAPLATFLNAADVLCLPTEYPEGLPTVLLEGAACGCALMVTDTGGTHELIPDGGFGIVLANTEPTHIAQQLRELIQNPDRLHALQRKALEHVRSRFTWDQTASAVERALKNSDR